MIAFLCRLAGYFPDLLSLLGDCVTDLTHFTLKLAEEAFASRLRSFFVATGEVRIATFFDAVIRGISLFYHASVLSL